MPVARTAPATRPLSASAFLEQPDDAPLPAVVVLAGDDRWLREECLRVIVRRRLGSDDPGDALVSLDAAAPEGTGGAGSALDEFRTPTLFGGRKVVTLARPEEAVVPAEPGTKGKGDPFLHFAAAATRSRAGAPHLEAMLVLTTARGIKGKSAVPTERLSAAGALVVDCRSPYDAPAPWETSAAPHEHELARFLVRRMKYLHGKRLPIEDAHLLTRRAGSELAVLEGALRTLAIVAAGRDAVGAEEIVAAIGETREDPAWRLSDAVLDRDPARALALAEAAFERGLSDAKGTVTIRPDALFLLLTATLHNAFRRVLLGAEVLARGGTPEEAARAAGIAPFLARGFADRCRRDPDDLLRRHGAFLEAETGVRGGGVPPRVAFERMIVRLSAREGVRPGA
jgi:DNA polymerase III delta subunit